VSERVTLSALIALYVCAGKENVIVDAVKLFTVTGMEPIVPVQPTIRSLGSGDVGSRSTVNSIALRFNGDPETEPNGRVELSGS
jgi:hypothetical protein